jgi:hypothetical protein
MKNYRDASIWRILVRQNRNSDPLRVPPVSKQVPFYQSFEALNRPVGTTVAAYQRRIFEDRGRDLRICICVGQKGGAAMLWTIFVILLILWLVGIVSSYTLGGFIHLLLVIALVVLLLNLISGRRPVV